MSCISHLVESGFVISFVLISETEIRKMLNKFTKITKKESSLNCLAKTLYIYCSVSSLTWLLIYFSFRQVLTNDGIKLCNYWWSNSRLKLYLYYWLMTSKLILNVLTENMYSHVHVIQRRQKHLRVKMEDHLKNTTICSGKMTTDFVVTLHASTERTPQRWLLPIFLWL